MFRRRVLYIRLTDSIVSSIRTFTSNVPVFLSLSRELFLLDSTRQVDHRPSVCVDTSWVTIHRGGPTLYDHPMLRTV